MTRLLPALLVIGCHTEQVCVLTPEPVGDDDPTGLGTARELLAPVEGLHGATGHYEDETEVAVDVEVTRGEGSAQLLRASWEDERRWGLDLGDESILVLCEDRLQVPVRLAVSTHDGVIGMDEPALLASPLWDEGVSVDVDVPPGELEGVPVPDDVEPEYGFARAAFGDGELAYGHLGYGGSTEESAWARYVLTW